MAEQHQRTAQRDAWVALGMSVSAVSAAVSSFDGLRSLAIATGWNEWQAPLLPMTVDAFAFSAMRTWLLGSTVSARARRLARSGAIGAVALSLSGNGFWHLASAGLVPLHWIVVLAVGAVPPVALAVIVHLAAVRSQDDRQDEAVSQNVRVEPEDEPQAVHSLPSTVPEPPGTILGTDSSSANGKRYASEDELLEAARTADSEHRRRYGRPITRDRLRRELHIGSQRATEVLRRLRTAS